MNENNMSIHPQIQLMNPTMQLPNHVKRDDPVYGIDSRVDYIRKEMLDRNLCLLTVEERCYDLLDRQDLNDLSSISNLLRPLERKLREETYDKTLPYLGPQY